ncbi:hypothetical protein DIPPA_17860 [Diplonema papillatum]|nr:hypothetical protein DIPPA_17860 [Diplonema papillatum]
MSEGSDITSEKPMEMSKGAPEMSQDVAKGDAGSTTYGKDEMLVDQWEKIKSQQTELTNKDVKMNKMHHMLSLQGQQLEVMEQRRRREEDLVRMNVTTPHSNEALKKAVTVLQMTLQDRDERITKLTADLRSSFEKSGQLVNQVNDLSVKVEEDYKSRIGPPPGVPEHCTA